MTINVLRPILVASIVLGCASAIHPFVGVLVGIFTGICLLAYLGYLTFSFPWQAYGLLITILVAVAVLAAMLLLGVCAVISRLGLQAPSCEALSFGWAFEQHIVELGLGALAVFIPVRCTAWWNDRRR